MMSAEKQAVEFFVKRATYAETLADQHCRDNELEKGITLYKQAFAFMKKAEKNLPDDDEVKTQLNGIKTKYQSAKIQFEAQ